MLNEIKTPTQYDIIEQNKIQDSMINNQIEEQHQIILNFQTELETIISKIELAKRTKNFLEDQLSSPFQ